MDDIKLEKYWEISDKLNRVAKVLLKSMTENEMRNYILKERKANQDGMINRLIDVPKNVKKLFKESYIKEEKDKNGNETEECREIKEAGEIGLINNETFQYDRIKDMIFLVLLSNRLKNRYTKMLEEGNLTEEETKRISNNKKVMLRYKDNATSSLIASIFVLENTGKDYKEVFSYGNRLDEHGKDSLVMDIPCIGQICVHYGNEENKDAIIKKAQNKALIILEKKQILGQITVEELTIIKEKIINNGILPNYNSKLYEYHSTFPLEYEGENIQRVKEQLGLKGKLPEDLTKDDIEKIKKSDLNDRELHYLGVKLEFPKKQLEWLEDNEKKNDVIEDIRNEYTKSINYDDLNKANNTIRNLIKNENTIERN